MSKIIDKIVGDLNEKREYKQIEARAKSLPHDYAHAYTEIRNYIFRTSGLVTMSPLKTLVEILEEAAANKHAVTDVVGTDVAAFADELVKGEKSCYDEQRTRLNAKFKEK